MTPGTGLVVACTQIVFPKAAGWCCTWSHAPAASRGVSQCLEEHSEVSVLPHEVGSGISELRGLAGSKWSSWARELFCSADGRPLPEWLEKTPSCTTLENPGLEIEISPTDYYYIQIMGPPVVMWAGREQFISNAPHYLAGCPQWMKGPKAVSWLHHALQVVGLPGRAEGPDQPPWPCFQCPDSLLV